ncbi:hypothetical protein [Sorangium cellulosum]|uniref:Uncharacterized protein n=1 Tax=Sorangium cellulosum TaxID=56 RepID=A0A150QSE4_SORCE|nr:hypothetical protein [Sorangium cellulosum]KYF70874.1 hypothetical protein BE15_30680 [Sorangium cellulosum]
MAELRAISTRAGITPTRFWNGYQRGDLKAVPAKLLERYFDAHLYFANWGKRRLMFRLPAAGVDTKQPHPYFPGSAARMTKAGEHVVFELVSETEDDFTRGASLASLAPVRSELLRGDLRAAYLAWLLAVEAGDVEDDETEPPLPLGLHELSAPLEAMVAFLRLDGDLLSAASEPSGAEPDDADALRAWVGALQGSMATARGGRAGSRARRRAAPHVPCSGEGENHQGSTDDRGGVGGLRVAPRRWRLPGGAPGGPPEPRPP